MYVYVRYLDYVLVHIFRRLSGCYWVWNVSFFWRWYVPRRKMGNTVRVSGVRIHTGVWVRPFGFCQVYACPWNLFSADTNLRNHCRWDQKYMSIYIYIHVYVYIYICIHKYTHIYLCIHCCAVEIAGDGQPEWLSGRSDILKPAPKATGLPTGAGGYPAGPNMRQPKTVCKGPETLLHPRFLAISIYPAATPSDAS